METICGGQTRLRLQWLVGCCCFVTFQQTAIAGPTEDAFTAGYAAAVLESQFDLQAGSLRVKDGVITIATEDLAGRDRTKIVEALSQIRGAMRVEVTDEPTLEPSTPVIQPDRATTVGLGKTTPQGGDFLPSGNLFEPLIAEPRWPHFAAIYQNYLGHKDFENVGAANLGTTFGIYENDFPGAGRWQIGLQAGVFSIFDLDASSTDLINADYWLAVPLSYRHEDFSGLFRVFHQSSHLGDEFLLSNNIERINLAYEGVDLRLSHDFFERLLRLYGGGAYIFHTEDELDRWSGQAGIELRSPHTILGSILRPIAATDVQAREATDWGLDVSARAGFQFESAKLRDRYLQLLLEYYNGNSPNGQFSFDDNIESIGLGIHFYYD